MKTLNTKLFCTVIFIAIITGIDATVAANKKDIQKINNSIIYDLFMNFELTGKNGNLSTIIDFLPNMSNVNFKNIKLTSNAGGEDQYCSFIFNENGIIENIAYEINNIIYKYDFVYEGNRLTSINIGGKPKISFGYNKKMQLITIKREKSGGAFEYNFEYLDGENKANIKLVVIQGEKKSLSPRNYYVTWDNQFKINAYCLDVYCSKNIQYAAQGDLLSYSFSTANADNNLATWDYTGIDEKGNWIERKSNKILFSRTIVYK
jgi:hypothetical protein